MRKIIFVLVIGLLMVGANAYADGDLVVNGKIGIGTGTDPLFFPLMVETDGITNMKIRSTSGTDNIAFVFDNFNGGTGDGGVWTFQVLGTSGIWQIRDAVWDSTPFRVEKPSTADQSNAFYINHLGNVGIGKTDPLSKLAIDGLTNSPPDASGNMGMICITNDGNLWVDDDGTYDCL